jgi:fibronectin-binding autotransporter adhesin
MNLDKCRSIVFALAMGGLFLAALFVLLGGASPVARADPGSLFISPTGSGTECSQANPCALQTALSLANDGDILYLAQGTYTGTGAAVITLTRSITLYGGWDGAPSGPVTRDPAAYPTVLDGERARRVVYISGDITPTLDGLIIARGNATGLTEGCPTSSGNPDGCGGGIFAYGAHPLIVNNIISDNVAALTTAGYPTGTTGYGGGLYLRDADRAVISGNVVISNVAGAADCGNGGGMFLFGAAEGARIEANRVLSNYATTTNMSCAWGGGISGGPGGALIRGNLVEGNWSNAMGTGYGAGLYQWYGAAHYVGNVVRGNRGKHAVYLGYSRSRFEDTWVVDNLTNEGLQLYNSIGGGPTLINNVIARSGGTTFAAYGHVAYPLTATLLHNTLVGSGSGYGVYVEDYVTLFLTNTIVAGHTWGITSTYPTSSTIFADHTLFWANAHDGLRGTNPIDGDPRFLNPAAGDYHLGPGSAALDAGVDAGVATDIDGDARPMGAGYDLGADEAEPSYRLYLPFIRSPIPEDL